MVKMDVTIPKGTIVKTTHPSGEMISKRKQIVNCFVSTFCDNIVVMWVGAGGYWRWVNVGGVVDVNPELKEYLDKLRE